MGVGKEVNAGLGGGTLFPLKQWGMKEGICKGRESCSLGGDSRVVIWATELNWTELNTWERTPAVWLEAGMWKEAVVGQVWKSESICEWNRMGLEYGMEHQLDFWN